MKYKTIKPLPGIEVGTVFEYNKDIITGQYGVTLVEGDNIGGLFDFIEGFGLDNDFFEKVEENKIKSFPTGSDGFYEIKSYGEIEWVYAHNDDGALYQGNWKWTREEAEFEIKRRAAIERVRRFLVENDLLEEDKSKPYLIFFTIGSTIFTQEIPGKESYYSPYGRIKKKGISQGTSNLQNDLLMIHG